MPTLGAAPGAAFQNTQAALASLLSPARAEASRRNGAKSRGPRTPRAMRGAPEPQAAVAPNERPTEPEARRIPDIAMLPPADEPETEDLPDLNNAEYTAPPGRHASARREDPKEPEARRNPGGLHPGAPATKTVMGAFDPQGGSR
jgi:hypothetical protein